MSYEPYQESYPKDTALERECFRRWMRRMDELGYHVQTSRAFRERLGIPGPSGEARGTATPELRERQKDLHHERIFGRPRQPLSERIGPPPEGNSVEIGDTGLVLQRTDSFRKNLPKDHWTEGNNE